MGPSCMPAASAHPLRHISALVLCIVKPAIPAAAALIHPPRKCEADVNTGRDPYDEVQHGDINKGEIHPGELHTTSSVYRADRRQSTTIRF